ncbi:MAG: T9SS type A sorting domain-containing protein [Bacteroidales bacterium]
MQAAYETFGCNAGNTFFIGIDKGNDNVHVLAFDSIYGVHYPGVSGNQGGGNIVHLLYDVQATPTIVVIRPDRSIAVKQVYPPAYQNVVDSILMTGGIPQDCLTAVEEIIMTETFAIHPNPVRQNAILNFDLAEDDFLMTNIYNSNGQLVRMAFREAFRSGKHSVNIDFTGLEGGLYFVNLVNQKGVQRSLKINLTP